jgi:hypothetical protein
MNEDKHPEKIEVHEYTPKDRRKALAAAYSILLSPAVQKRYDMTRFGVTMSDPASYDNSLSLDDVTNCLVLMHNDLAKAEKAGTEEAKPE